MKFVDTNSSSHFLEYDAPLVFIKKQQSLETKHSTFEVQERIAFFLLTKKLLTVFFSCTLKKAWWT